MVPFELSTRLWNSPAAIATTPFRPVTGPGFERSTFVPSPSVAYALRPHAHTVPSGANASECCRPAATLPAEKCGTLYAALLTALVVAPARKPAAFNVKL